jgi:hypothetical protein
MYSQYTLNLNIGIYSVNIMSIVNWRSRIEMHISVSRLTVSSVVN